MSKSCSLDFSLLVAYTAGFIGLVSSLCYIILEGRGRGPAVSDRSDLFMISLPGGRFQMLKFCSVNKDKFSSQNFFSVFVRRLRNCATSYEVSRSVAISVQR